MSGTTARYGGSTAVSPSREELRAHLAESRIAGDVATPRENNLRNIAAAVRRDPLYSFGLTWSDVFPLIHRGVIPSRISAPPAAPAGSV